ncbi:MAG TPA: UvrD-helicase domain-containing protein [Cytophagaceae bacterium]|jgi:DNA helicase-2/ATP-dependent DNA helicase PcrA|nr:UvrD-helicase domain-containing protein [Cytophagaceae bacterium]
MSYLDSLNEPQKQAVLNTEGPSMIIAGAGSGKTRVLTLRIAHLIEKGVDPFNILALTFTNKASREMRHRIEHLVGTDARNLWMGTFHAVFSRILRAEADKIGYPKAFTIYDTEDSKSLIRQIIKEQYLDDKIYKTNMVLNRISAAKNRLISSSDYLNNATFRTDDEASMRPELGKLYKIYQDRCFKAGAMDFDDLLFNTNLLFREHLDVLNKYQNRFKYALVDEFQDTNLSQYNITRKLSSQNRNICVVGDDAQSIYAFRGADIQNILNFEKDYPELQIFKLEQNYRSTQNIVNAANSVITKNKAQLKKTVWTENESGNLIEVLRANTDNEEGSLVATAIFEEKMQNHLKNSDFAILYRTNSQSRAMEEALRRRNIKYRVVGGVSFYQRKEIKDILAYLRYSLNNNDEQSLRRIINYPKRGIGEASVSKLLVAAEDNGVTLWEAMQNVNSFMAGKTATGIENFVTQIKSFATILGSKDAYEAASRIAQESGLVKELFEDKTIEGLNRYENVQELLNAIKEFVDMPDNQDKSLGAFLQDISLLTDADNEKDSDPDKVTLMTIHSSKGLEFRNVYIVGLEEDLFPSQMMLSSRADLEEERRLFYVAITRAQKHLTVSYSNTRYRFGRLKPCEPSRFLTEFDSQFLNISRRQVIQPVEKPNIIQKPKAFNSPVNSRPKLNYIPTADFKPSDTSNLLTGMKVEHPKFGFGIVKAMDVAGTDRKAIIDFNGIEKTLILSFAKLKIHNS